MPENRHVAVTREGAVGSLKMLMIVLAASIFWQAAAAVNGQMHVQGMSTAAPFLRGASRLLIGTESTAPFQDRLMDFWVHRHRLIALIAMLAAVTLLMARYVILGRLFDYVYMESNTRNRRMYAGFVANIFLALVHAGMIYGLAILGQNEHASLVPVTLLALLLFNALWFGAILLGSRKEDREELRGLSYMIATSLGAGVVLFLTTMAIEVVPVTDAHMRGSEMILLTAGVAATLCLIDGAIQNVIYSVRPSLGATQG